MFVCWVQMLINISLNFATQCLDMKKTLKFFINPLKQYDVSKFVCLFLP